MLSKKIIPLHIVHPIAYTLCLTVFFLFFTLQLQGAEQQPAATNVDHSQQIKLGQLPDGLTTTDWVGIQQAYVKASNTDAGDYFGSSIAISGDTVVVGAYYEESGATGINGDESDNSAGNAGAAYVFVRSGGIWTQEAYLKAPNTDADDRFGRSVDISGDTVVVGAIWEDSNATGVNGDESNNSVDSAGAAYVFIRNGSVWSQEAYLKASNTGFHDYFGYSVGISGDTVVVGAPQEDSSATGVNGDGSDNFAATAGAAYIFVRNENFWSQEAYLKASNTDADDHFGSSVDISGNTVVVGTHFEDSSATGINGDESNNSLNAGAAYVFVRNGSVWSQEAYLKASNTDAGDNFGISVSISSDTIVVGANNEESSTMGINGDENDNMSSYSGAAYVFVRNGGIWNQEAYLKASNTDTGDYFGGSVGISDDTVVVGAYLEDSNATGSNGDESDNSANAAGAAYVFVRSKGIWNQETYLKASNTDAHDTFGGSSVSISDDTIIAGASLEDSHTTGVNGDESDNSADSAGAAYVFVLNVPPTGDDNFIFLPLVINGQKE
ncbi:MAG: integrin [Chloroflexi bacterium]|nr:MAG: integrin [Chloroflexota bacterium]